MKPISLKRRNLDLNFFFFLTGILRFTDTEQNQTCIGPGLFAGAAVFYMAGGFTCLSSLLFLVLPTLENTPAAGMLGTEFGEMNVGQFFFPTMWVGCSSALSPVEATRSIRGLPTDLGRRRFKNSKSGHPRIGKGLGGVNPRSAAAKIPASWLT